MILRPTEAGRLAARVAADGGTTTDLVEVRKAADDFIARNKEMYDKATLVMLPGSGKAGKLYCIKGGSDVQYTRNSVKWVRRKSGLLTTVSENMPAFDWDPIQEKYILLSEIQRTNVLYYSRLFGSGYYDKIQFPVSVEDNFATAPDGTLTAARISAVNDTGALFKATVCNAGDVKSIYARTVNGTGQCVILDYNAGAPRTLTEQWQKFEIRFDQCQTLGNLNYYVVDFRNTSGLKELLVWQSQVEAGDTASSSIYTNGSTETRLADTGTVVIPEGTIRIITTVDGADEIDESPVPGNVYTLPYGKIEKVVMLAA